MFHCVSVFFLVWFLFFPLVFISVFLHYFHRAGSFFFFTRLLLYNASICVHLYISILFMSLSLLLPTFGLARALFDICFFFVFVFDRECIFCWLCHHIALFFAMYFRKNKNYAKSKILFNEKLQTVYLKIGINYVVSCVVLKITTNIACLFSVIESSIQVSYIWCNVYFFF